MPAAIAQRFCVVSNEPSGCDASFGWIATSSAFDWPAGIYRDVVARNGL